MWPDRVSSSGPLALESDALPTALCGPAICRLYNNIDHTYSYVYAYFKMIH